jgi:hypothetical protein
MQRQRGAGTAEMEWTYVLMNRNRDASTITFRLRVQFHMFWQSYPSRRAKVAFHKGSEGRLVTCESINKVDSGAVSLSGRQAVVMAFGIGTHLRMDLRVR